VDDARFHGGLFGEIRLMMVADSITQAGREMPLLNQDVADLCMTRHEIARFGLEDGFPFRFGLTVGIFKGFRIEAT
jgi:hypothetical protein